VNITLKQSGGLAGLRVVHRLDTADLAGDGPAVEALARAVAAQSVAPAAPHPDGLGYTLTIDDAGGKWEVHASDASATPEFARLAAEVRKRGNVG
jgi:hypothetical protein